MWETIFWILVVVVVIGLIWYFLKQKKTPTPPEKPGGESGFPSETP